METLNIMRRLLPVIATLVPICAPAQASEREVNDGRVPVLVAQLAESIPGGPAPIIIRRMTGSPRDIILLPHNASVQTLASALFILVVTRAADGDTAIRASKVRVPALGQRNPFGDRENVKMLRALNRLRQASPSSMGDIGLVRTTVLRLSPAKSVLKG